MAAECSPSDGIDDGRVQPDSAESRVRDHGRASPVFRLHDEPGAAEEEDVRIKVTNGQFLARPFLSRYFVGGRGVFVEWQRVAAVCMV